MEGEDEYEWLLSYAVWTALAGFVAVVVFGKDSNFRPPSSERVAAVLTLITSIHCFYLWLMVRNTLHDLDVQTRVEQAMLRLLSDDEELRDIHLGARTDTLRWVWKRYGLWSQVGITVVLCLGAAWATNARRSAIEEQSKSVAIPTGYICNGCTQQFGPISSGAAVPPTPPNPPTRRLEGFGDDRGIGSKSPALDEAPALTCSVILG